MGVGSVMKIIGVRKSVMMFVLFAALLCSGNIVLAPVEIVLCGESFELWAHIPEKVRQVLPEDAVYCWHQVGGVRCVGEELDSWLSVSEFGDCPVSVGASEAGHLELQLEIQAGGRTVFKQSKVLEVLDGTKLSREKQIDVRKRLGVIRGLHWLQLHQRESGCWGILLEEEETLVRVTYGGTQYYNEVASTGMALWAFGAHGFGLSNDTGNPFAESVERGLSYLGSKVLFLEHGSYVKTCPEQVDVNGNGLYAIIGQRGGVENYYHPIAVTGIVVAGCREHRVMTARGERTLEEIVEDGRDFILKQLYVNTTYRAWRYSDHADATGQDLSIAGWNYLALDALRGWGHRYVKETYQSLQYFLTGVYDAGTHSFQYNWSNWWQASGNLNASGVIGLRFILDNNLDEESFLWLRCFSEPPDIRESEDYDVELSTGEILARVTGDMMRWVSETNNYGSGYTLWSICKALLMCQVTSRYMDGREFDWRYGGYLVKDGWEVWWPGVWECVLREQNSEGSWEITAADYINSMQVELNHAMMVLALSEQVFAPIRKGGMRVDVTCIVPEEVGERVWTSGWLRKEKLDDGTWMLSGEGELSDEAMALDASYWYGTSEGEAGGSDVIQLGGVVGLEDGFGVRQEVELGELCLERAGTGYGLSVGWEGECREGGLFYVSVLQELPKGDMRSLVHVPASASGDISLFELGDEHGIATWLDVESLCGAGTAMRWLSKGWSGDSRWHEFSFDGEPAGRRGRILGVDAGVGWNEEQFWVLYYNVIPLEVEVSVANVGGPWKVLERRRVSLSDFGSKRAWSVSASDAGLVAGDVQCRARLYRGDEVLASAEAWTVLDALPSGEVSQLIRVAEDVEQGDWQRIVSEVFSCSGHAVSCSGNVRVVVDGSDECWEWQYDGSAGKGKQTRTFYLDTSQLSLGEHVVTQTLLLEDGRVLETMDVFEVMGVTEALIGEFEQEYYEVAQGRSVTIGFVADNAMTADWVGVDFVCEQAAAFRLGNVECHAFDAGVLQGDVELSVVEPPEQDGSWIVLTDTRNGNLLDIAEVLVVESGDDVEEGGDDVAGGGDDVEEGGDDVDVPEGAELGGVPGAEESEETSGEDVGVLIPDEDFVGSDDKGNDDKGESTGKDDGNGGKGDSQPVYWGGGTRIIRNIDASVDGGVQGRLGKELLEKRENRGAPVRPTELGSISSESSNTSSGIVWTRGNQVFTGEVSGYFSGKRRQPPWWRYGKRRRVVAEAQEEMVCLEVFDTLSIMETLSGFESLLPSEVNDALESFEMHDVMDVLAWLGGGHDMPLDELHELSN